jgi:hypothetical protein
MEPAKTGVKGKWLRSFNFELQIPNSKLAPLPPTFFSFFPLLKPEAGQAGIANRPHFGVLVRECAVLR